MYSVEVITNEIICIANNISNAFLDMGGFQLEFVSISRVINHITCYNLSALIGGKFTLKKSFAIFALQSECCNFNQLEFITGHVIYNPIHI